MYYKIQKLDITKKIVRVDGRDFKFGDRGGVLQFERVKNGNNSDPFLDVQIKGKYLAYMIKKIALIKLVNLL